MGQAPWIRSTETQLFDSYVREMETHAQFSFNQDLFLILVPKRNKTNGLQKIFIYLFILFVGSRTTEISNDFLHR